jgi:hypothetical protein
VVTASHMSGRSGRAHSPRTRRRQRRGAGK